MQPLGHALPTDIALARASVCWLGSKGARAYALHDAVEINCNYSRENTSWSA